jgi:hypothetical protein
MKRFLLWPIEARNAGWFLWLPVSALSAAVYFYDGRVGMGIAHLLCAVFVLGVLWLTRRR